MKILFIDPPGWQGAREGNRAFPNIGIAYLSAALKKQGHTIDLLDLNNLALSDKDVIRHVELTSPDIISFSIKTATFKASKQLGMIIKQKFADIKILVGGPHITLFREDLLREKWIDVIFIGEGERLLPDIIKLTLDAQFKENIFISKEKDISDLDDLEFPDYTIFPDNVKVEITKNYPIVTSRGCPYQCIYCSVPKISGNKTRLRSPSNIIKELQHAIEVYGVRGVEIIDDCWNINIDRCKEMCTLIIANAIQLDWTCPNGIRADRIDSELAVLMRKSGCKKVFVGVESACPKVFSTIRKGTSLEKIITGINILKNAGIKVGGYFIIGLPGDNFKNVMKSLNFARKMEIEPHFNILIPYPKTELFKWVNEYGVMRTPLDEGVHFTNNNNLINITFETADFSAKDRRRAYLATQIRLNNYSILQLNKKYRWMALITLTIFILKNDPTYFPVFFLSKVKLLVKRLIH